MRCLLVLVLMICLSCSLVQESVYPPKQAKIKQKKVASEFQFLTYESCSSEHCWDTSYIQWFDLKGNVSFSMEVKELRMSLVQIISLKNKQGKTSFQLKVSSP